MTALTVGIFGLLGGLLGWLMHSLAATGGLWNPEAGARRVTWRFPAAVRVVLSAARYGAVRPGAAREVGFALHLIAEVLSVAVFAGAALLADDGGAALQFAGAYTFCLLIALIDLHHRLVPNRLTYPAAALIVVATVLGGGSEWLMVMGGGFALALFGLAAWLRPGQVGGGDIKLALLIGLALGFPGVLWGLLIGILSGGGAAIVLLAGRRAASTGIAYAPYLCLGALIALVYNPFAALM